MCSCAKSAFKRCFVRSCSCGFLRGGKLIRSKAASSNTAVNNICKAVHPFLSQHLVRVLTEDAVDGMTDDERGLLGPHLCPHNQRQAMLSKGLALWGKGIQKRFSCSCPKGVRAPKSVCGDLPIQCEQQNSHAGTIVPDCGHRRSWTGT